MPSLRRYDAVSEPRDGYAAQVIPLIGRAAIAGQCMRMITTRWVISLWLAICWTMLVSPGQAHEAEKAFYAGKTVRMIVGAGVGGGFHVFSRMIAPYLAETLGATVIVENQPGAGGLVALNRLYTATPDGLQISLSNGTMAAFAQLTEDARFDLAQFTYLSTVGTPPGLWLVGPDSPIREVQQAIDSKEKMALGLRRRNVHARHRGGLYLRGTQARLPCGAGI
jgi:hypothetical protein